MANSFTSEERENRDSAIAQIMNPDSASVIITVYDIDAEHIGLAVIVVGRDHITATKGSDEELEVKSLMGTSIAFAHALPKTSIETRYRLTRLFEGIEDFPMPERVFSTPPVNYIPPFSKN